METIKIGTQEWATKDLKVLTFLNGEKIKIAKNAKQWQKAGEEEMPICCFHNFNREDNENIGIYYNYHCLTDPRGLIAKEFRVPTADDFITLLNETGLIENNNRWYFDGDNSSLFQTENDSLFKAVAGGMVSQWGSFFNKGESFQSWTSTRLSDYQSYNLTLNNSKIKSESNSAVISTPYENAAGFTIRLLLDN